LIKKEKNMKLLRNFGGALSLALLVGATVSSVPLRAQAPTLTAFSAERTISLTNVLTTVTPTVPAALLASLAAGAVQIREQTSYNPQNSTLTSTLFTVASGSPANTNLAQVPFGSFIATTAITVDRIYVTSAPTPAVMFVGTVTQSPVTPYGNFSGAAATYSFGYTAANTTATPPTAATIGPVIEQISGIVVLYSASASGTFTITAPATTGGGGAGAVTVVINGSTSATPTLTTVVNQLVLDASATTTSTGGTLTFAFALAPGSPSAAITGGNTSKASVQLNSGQNTYKFTLTITDSKGTTPTVVPITVVFI
jgi:hypothetical protein